MAKKKTPRKEDLFRRAKEKPEPDKKNYTFRLNKMRMEEFVKMCEAEDVKPTAVLEEFLKEFTGID